MKWSELPARFVEWVKTNNVSGFDGAIEIIAKSGRTPAAKPKSADRDFVRLIKDVRDWTPARRRNSEESYKIELRGHLASLNYVMNEEHGQSNVDLIVGQEYAIEIKKHPTLGEYDRPFGQLARHLQHQCKVIALILEAAGQDNFDNFTTLIDRYLDIDKNSVEVIKK